VARTSNADLSPVEVIIILLLYLPQASAWGGKKLFLRALALLFSLKKFQIYIMPFIKIWIHVVWSTKNRVPSLLKTTRQKIFQHIKDNGKLKNIHVDFVNGHIDHVHCLISLKATQDIATIVQLLKGESSYWD
jgi:hypothetical protein